MKRLTIIAYNSGASNSNQLSKFINNVISMVPAEELLLIDVRNEKNLP
ncbi:MAG: hypothetical protein HOP11_09570 [Saprospiraceae bacterium]|nr:hypothetical protein [Saprospiraceae bacterium]